VLRRIFGPKRDEVTGDWRKLHNEELHNMYYSPNIIRIIKFKEDEMGRTCSTYGGEKSAYSASIGKCEGKRPVGRQRRKWEDSTTKDLKRNWMNAWTGFI
jgi:hypothetical protein